MSPETRRALEGFAEELERLKRHVAELENKVKKLEAENSDIPGRGSERPKSPMKWKKKSG